MSLVPVSYLWNDDPLSRSGMLGRRFGTGTEKVGSHVTEDLPQGYGECAS